MMSTRYGTVRVRDGSVVYVEAYGATGCVKIEKKDGVALIEIDDTVSMSRLITALEIAAGHCWK